MKNADAVSKGIALLTAAAALVFFNISVKHKEDLLQAGKETLFQLAPRDPRSLMQGDYMVLRYRIAEDLEEHEQARENEAAQKPDHRPSNPMPRGLLALKINNKVAVSARVIASKSETAEDEILLEYKRVGDEFQIGSESFFFQEGEAKIYENARYADLRIDKNGRALLVGLRDEGRKKLGKSLGDP